MTAEQARHLLPHGQGLAVPRRVGGRVAVAGDQGDPNAWPTVLLQAPTAVTTGQTVTVQGTATAPAGGLAGFYQVDAGGVSLPVAFADDGSFTLDLGARAVPGVVVSVTVVDARRRQARDSVYAPVVEEPEAVPFDLVMAAGYEESDGFITRVYNDLDPSRVTWLDPQRDDIYTAGLRNGSAVMLKDPSYYGSSLGAIYYPFQSSAMALRYFFPDQQQAGSPTVQATMYAVLRVNIESGNDADTYILDLANNGGTRWRMGMTYHPPYNPSYDFLTIDGLAVDDGAGGYLPAIPGVWFLIVFVFDQVAGTLRIRAPDHAIDRTISKGLWDFENLDQLYVHSRYGDVAEIILRPGIDDAATMAGMEATLRTRWGLT